jgi:hypothetical protein
MLSFVGNPLALVSSYPEDVLVSPLGERLMLLDDVEAAPAREAALTAAAKGEAAAAVAREAAAAVVTDVEGIIEPVKADGAGAGATAGAPLGPEGELEKEPIELVTLRFSLSELTGLPESGSGLQNDAHNSSAAALAADGAAPSSCSGERFQVRMDLLDQGRSSAPLPWSSTVAIGGTFDLTLPRTVALRDSLISRGVAFQWILLPIAQSDSGALEPDFASSTESAGAAARSDFDGKGAEAPPPVPPEGRALCTMLPTWRPLLYGKKIHSQRVSATVHLPVPPKGPGEKRLKKMKPVELTMTMAISCTILPEAA